MADIVFLRTAQRRAARGRGPVHRKPPPTGPRRDRSRMRATDIVLVLAGLALLGSLAIWGSINLAGRSLAP
jgi:hypothetical protein